MIGEASLLKLTVRHTDGTLETINTTDEHPFHDATTGEWTRADVLQPGDLLSTLSGNAEILSITYDGQRVPVYNLSIPGSPTYYIGERGVWVHNCPTWSGLRKSPNVRARGGRWKGERWPAAKYGDAVAAGETHSHAYGILKGSNMPDTPLPEAQRGWIVFLNNDGTAWRFVPDP